jgi:hypothetical protein
LATTDTYLKRSNNLGVLQIYIVEIRVQKAKTSRGEALPTQDGKAIRLIAEEPCKGFEPYEGEGQPRAITE